MNNRRVAQGLTVALISAVAAISMPTGVQAATDPKPGKGTVASQETDDGHLMYLYSDGYPDTVHFQLREGRVRGIEWNFGSAE